MVRGWGLSLILLSEALRLAQKWAGSAVGLVEQVLPTPTFRRESQVSSYLSRYWSDLLHQLSRSGMRV